jgi:hypothetical protein
MVILCAMFVFGSRILLEQLHVCVCVCSDCMIAGLGLVRMRAMFLLMNPALKRLHFKFFSCAAEVSPAVTYFSVTTMCCHTWMVARPSLPGKQNTENNTSYRAKHFSSIYFSQGLCFYLRIIIFQIGYENLYGVASTIISCNTIWHHFSLQA